MPARAPTTRINTGGGFGGFTPNPSIPYPGGRVLASDVEDAANALNFGATVTPAPRISPTATASPRPTPTATPTVTPNLTNMDVGNFSVSRSLFADDSYNNRTYSPGREYPGDYGFTEPRGSAGIDPGVDFAPTREGTGRSPTLITDPNEDWIGDSNAPRVATANPEGLPNGPGGMDDEPIIGTNHPSGPTVQLFNGVRGDRGIQFWNTPASRAPTSMPWWTTFNPNIGLNMATTFDRIPGGVADTSQIPSGPGPAALENIPWATDVTSTYTPPGPDRTDPGFVDGTGSEPPAATGETSTASSSTRRTTNPAGGPPAIAPVAPPGNHWDYTRGTYVDNDFAGGAQFDSRAADLMTAWSQSMPGAPNRWSPDIRDTFAPGSVGVLDEDTGILRGVRSSQMAGFKMSQKAAAPALRVGDPKSAAAYNAWLMQQPEWKSFMQRMLAGKPTG